MLGTRQPRAARVLDYAYLREGRCHLQILQMNTRPFQALHQARGVALSPTVALSHRVHRDCNPGSDVAYLRRRRNRVKEKENSPTLPSTDCNTGSDAAYLNRQQISELKMIQIINQIIN